MWCCGRRDARPALEARSSWPPPIRYPADRPSIRIPIGSHALPLGLLQLHRWRRLIRRSAGAVATATLRAEAVEAR